jgi:hypothetical protein
MTILLHHMNELQGMILNYDDDTKCYQTTELKICIKICVQMQ